MTRFFDFKIIILGQEWDCSIETVAKKGYWPKDRLTIKINSQADIQAILSSHE